MEEAAEKVSNVLTMSALIERQLYPVNAKWHLRNLEMLPVRIESRCQDSSMKCSQSHTYSSGWKFAMTPQYPSAPSRRDCRSVAVLALNSCMLLPLICSSFSLLTETFRQEIRVMDELIGDTYRTYCI